MKKKQLFAFGALVTSSALLFSGCASSQSAEDTSVTLRLWDENAAAVYEHIATTYEKQNPGVDIVIETVPWADYFSNLRQDVAAGNGPDLFWLNGASLGAYVTAEQIAPVTEVLEADPAKTFDNAVVEQYSVDGTLYGIPQTSDGGIVLYYNKELLAAAGVTEAELQDLRWSTTDAAADTFLPLVKRLTLDIAGNNADSAEFNADAVKQYGFNAAKDLQSIQLPFIGSNGGTYQVGEEFTLSKPESAAAYQYLVDLINTHHVSPAAADTNANGDYTRDAFLRGEIALFQSGSFNLANIANGASFEWGIAPQPAGDAGAVTVAPGVVTAVNAQAVENETAVDFANFIATADANRAFGDAGVAIPAVLDARDSFSKYWESANVDISNFFVTAETKLIAPATGEKFAEATQASGPLLDEIFIGRLDVAEGLKQADEAANAIVNN